MRGARALRCRFTLRDVAPVQTPLVEHEATVGGLLQSRPRLALVPLAQLLLFLPAKAVYADNGWIQPMTYLILARDGTSQIVLKRDNEDAAEKKARELKDMGWFEVEIRADEHGEKPAAV